MKAIYENNFKKFHSLFKKKESSSGQIDESENFIPKYPLLDDHLEWSLMPWTEYYSSPLNHVSLFRIIKPEQISSFKFVLARDGLFTLVDFFNRFPDPSVFTTIFIVHYSLREFVPAKWLRKILFYEYEVNSSAYEKSLDRDGLIVKGLIMRGTFDLEYLKNSLRNIIQYNQFKKVLICLLPRHNFFLNSKWNGDSLYLNEVAEFMKFLHCELANTVKFELIDWEDFFFVSDMHSYRFYDANAKSNVWVDDFTSFFLFKKGAMPLFLNESSSISEKDLIIPITHTHGIKVLSSMSAIESRYPEIQSILKMMADPKEEKLGQSSFEVLQDYFQKHVNPLPF